MRCKGLKTGNKGKTGQEPIKLATVKMSEGFPGGASGKNPHAEAGDRRDADLIPGLERSPREGSVNPLQYSCLENSTDRGA